MTHPGDDGGFGPLLDRNAFGSRHRPATDRSGMIRHGSCQTVGKIRVDGMEGQKTHDRTIEILDILGLDLVTSLSSRLFPFCVLFRGSLGIEFRPNAINVGRRCPHTFGKDFASLLFLYNPMIARSLHTTSERGVSWREQNPILRRRQNFAVG